MLRSIDRFVELDEMRAKLAPFYSHTGRPSIDPELLIRMLLVGYCSGIRSERRLCEEVHLNLAYRWFCRLGLDGAVPDHSTFSKNRHGRFRESDLFRQLFETVVRRAIKEGLVGGEGFAVDDHESDVYVCPAGKLLSTKGTVVNDGTTLLYRASKYDCDACPLKHKCCPKEPARKVPRSIHEGARDMARDIAKTDAYVESRRERKKIEMLFAHLKRILKLGRLRLRGPCGARDEFTLAAIAQNLRKLAKLIPMPQPAMAV
jgi:transposase